MVLFFAILAIESASDRRSSMQLHSSLLRYFDEVVRAGSIRGAAQKLNVASSAINRQVLRLEADLGVKLFERGARRLRLTAAGEILIHHVRRTLHDAERAKSEIENLQGLKRGVVRLAVIEGAATDLVIDAVVEFRKRYPRIRFFVQSLPSSLVPEQVLRGEADLGIAFNLPRIRGIRQITAARFDVGVVMRPDHPLAKRPKLSLTDCIQYPICVVDQSLSAGRLIEDAMMEVSVEVEPLIVCNSAEFLIKLVTSNLGIAFKSSLGLKREIKEKRLVFRHLEKPIHQRLALIESSGREHPIAARIFAESLRKSIEESDNRI
jgi:DNA-binding transcriptional LysR family regulator